MLYTYTCKDCNKSTDEIRGVCERDKPLEKKCLNKNPVNETLKKVCSNFKRKEVNSTSFELKGTGFHSTDYK
jgi:predicted nucleic acid-binding Zn ribbon protein